MIFFLNSYLELLGRDIVGIANEDTLVLIQQFRGLFKVGGLPCLSIPFDHFDKVKGSFVQLIKINDK